MNKDKYIKFIEEDQEVKLTARNIGRFLDDLLNIKVKEKWMTLPRTLSVYWVYKINPGRDATYERLQELSE